jgi:hypothetical protein
MLRAALSPTQSSTILSSATRTRWPAVSGPPCWAWPSKPNIPAPAAVAPALWVPAPVNDPPAAPPAIPACNALKMVCRMIMLPSCSAICANIFKNACPAASEPSNIAVCSICVMLSATLGNSSFVTASWVFQLSLSRIAFSRSGVISWLLACACRSCVCTRVSSLGVPNTCWLRMSGTLPAAATCARVSAVVSFSCLICACVRRAALASWIWRTSASEALTALSPYWALICSSCAWTRYSVLSCPA